MSERVCYLNNKCASTEDTAGLTPVSLMAGRRIVRRPRKIFSPKRIDFPLSHTYIFYFHICCSYHQSKWHLQVLRIRSCIDVIRITIIENDAKEKAGEMLDWSGRHKYQSFVIISRTRKHKFQKKIWPSIVQRKLTIFQVEFIRNSIWDVKLILEVASDPSRMLSTYGFTERIRNTINAMPQIWWEKFSILFDGSNIPLKCMFLYNSTNFNADPIV